MSFEKVSQQTESNPLEDGEKALLQNLAAFSAASKNLLALKKAAEDDPAIKRMIYEKIEQENLVVDIAEIIVITGELSLLPVPALKSSETLSEWPVANNQLDGDCLENESPVVAELAKIVDGEHLKVLNEASLYLSLATEKISQLVDKIVGTVKKS